MARTGRHKYRIHNSFRFIVRLITRKRFLGRPKQPVYFDTFSINSWNQGKVNPWSNGHDERSNRSFLALRYVRLVLPLLDLHFRLKIFKSLISRYQRISGRIDYLSRCLLYPATILYLIPWRTLMSRNEDLLQGRVFSNKSLANSSERQTDGDWLVVRCKRK